MIEQLSTITAVKDKQVPLFDDDVFDNLNTIEALWRKLRNFWSIRDYDILIIVLQLINCKEANDVFEEFLSKIDNSSLSNVDLILSCKPFEGEGIFPLLRIKISKKICTPAIEKEVKDIISKKFKVLDYSLCFKSIKEGCIELMYSISKMTMSHLLQYRVTSDDYAEFAAHKILSLQVGSTKFSIMSEMEDLVSKPYERSIQKQF